MFVIDSFAIISNVLVTLYNMCILSSLCGKLFRFCFSILVQYISLYVWEGRMPLL